MDDEMTVFIADLNETAESAVMRGMASVEAIEHTASVVGMVQVAEDGYLRMYKTTRAHKSLGVPIAIGTLVNCWINHPTSETIEEGGLGFDDQTDWYVRA